MKCAYCGFESEQDFSFCSNCGAAAQSSPAVSMSSEPVNAASEKVLNALKDSLFLVLCILMSVSCALTLVDSGPDVLSILFTIFLWLVYAQSRKGVANATHLRSVSGTVYAHYVIINVCAILLVVIGAIIGVAFGALSSDLGFLNEILAELDLGAYETEIISQVLVSVSGAVFFFAFALVGALLIVINMFSIRYVHRFAKSVYKSIESGTLALRHTKATYAWLIVFAVFSGISLLGNLDSGDFILIASNGVSCAMPIIAAILIKKHLTPEE